MKWHDPKTLHIHVGPHKTGSTAIQSALNSNHASFTEVLGLHVVSSTLLADLAKAMNDGNEAKKDALFKELRKVCEEVPGDCIMSCEDLSGELPGRTRKRRPYPTLQRNLRLIQKALAPHKCIFYFFVRDVDNWTKSAYTQNIKFRTRFSSLDSFRDFIRIDLLWDGVLSDALEKMPEKIVRIAYEENSTFSSVRSFLKAVSPDADLSRMAIPNTRENKSPADSQISIIEMINKSSASTSAKRVAKKALLSGCLTRQFSPDDLFFPDWPVEVNPPMWLNDDLKKLWDRVEQRVTPQVQPNLMPDPFCDLVPMRSQVVKASDDFPEGGRGAMDNQSKILSYRFRGLPKTCHLLGLTISYLRRDTEHTEHAAFLFQRLWAEEYELLLGTLQTRWLISSFQTFLEHGTNENQRVIGGSAYFFTNILKAYEAERALEGRPANTVYENTSPSTKMGFPGLDRFNLGGTDLLLNTNALLLELASRDEIAGRVVQEFMLRMKAASSIFTRMDRSRLEHGIDTPPFSDCWSFFEKPDH